MRHPSGTAKECELRFLQYLKNAAEINERWKGKERKEREKEEEKKERERERNRKRFFTQ